jgi:superfamily II DNA or RNA helicase
MIEQRQYQQEDVNYAMGHGTDHRIIHCAPTGSGKTVIQAMIAKREMDRGSSTAILTPRNEIFSQTFRLCSDFIGAHNVTALRARRQNESWNPVAPIHIVSWPTLVKRSKRSDWWFPKVERVLVDECHLSMAPKILEILEHYAPKARIDGYTATPARQTGKGLGHFFTEIKNVTSVRRLVKDGYLAPCEYWGGSTPDLAGIRIRAGDYEKKKLSDACVKLVGDAVDNWLRLASDRRTIVFAVDIAHCEMLAHKFVQVGIKAASLHVRLQQKQRDEIVRQFKAGEIQVLVNVSIASYGFDSPEVSCVQICRPTRSIVLHLQMIGRGMRLGQDQKGL